MEIQMPCQVETAIDMLEKAGFEGYAVGGCIRDTVMGRKPSDWDIATSATPDEVMEIFKSYKIIPTGIKHGTVTVVIDHFHMQITTFRTDGEYSDNRRPDSVSYAKTLKEDLSRRDFTMNALAYNRKTGIIDYFGGLSDIKQMTIRCVGSPDKRFSEDALRIMRAIRFASVLSMTMDEETHISIHKNRELLKNISAERIASEFNKLILGDYVEKILYEYKDVIGVFIPEILPAFGFDQRNFHHIYDVWGHIVTSIAVAPKLIYVRLAMLFHDIAKPLCLKFDSHGIGHFALHPKMGKEISRQVLHRLKYDNATIKIVGFLVLYHDTPMLPQKTEIKKWLMRYGKALIQLLLEVKIADNLAKNRSFPKRLVEAKECRAVMRKIIKNDECYSLKQLDINGSDLIKAGFSEDKTLGDILNSLLLAVIEEKCENKKEKLLEYAKTIDFNIYGC